MIFFFPFLRNPRPLIQPAIDLAVPLNKLYRGTLSYDQALRLSHQWAQLATRIVLAAALCFGMRKLKHWAGTRAKNWFASQYQAPLTPGSLASNLDLLKNKLTQRFSFQLSRQINQVYDLYIKSGVACGVLVSALTLFVVRLLANRIEYRTTLLAFHFHYVIDGINPLKSIKRVHQLGSIFNTLSSLQYAYSFILALQQVENFRPILARLNLLSSEEMQQIDPQAIEGLTVNHIQTLTRIPQENLTLPIDTLLQKIPGSLLKRQYEILAHNQLTPLIEKVASFLAPRVTRLFGYTRV